TIEEETSAPAEPAPTNGNGLIPASPTVRRFAREVGVDLRLVTGSGEGGRITREDVLAVVRHASQAVRNGGTAQPVVAKGPGEPASDTWGPIRVDRMPKIR